MPHTFECGHEAADWPVDGALLCTDCLYRLLRVLEVMDADDLEVDVFADLATEVLQ